MSRRLVLLVCCLSLACFGALAATGVSRQIAKPRPARAEAPKIVPLKGLALQEGHFPWQRSVLFETALSIKTGAGDVSAYVTAFNQKLTDTPRTKVAWESLRPSPWIAVQVSAWPFPSQEKDWQRPYGLLNAYVVKRGPTETTGTLDVDLAVLASLRFRTQPAQPSWPVLVSGFGGPKGAPVIDRGLMGRSAGVKILPVPPGRGQYHIRVVPLNAAGAPVGRPSNAVVVRAIEAYAPIPGLAEGHPKVSVQSYQPLQLEDADAAYWFVVTKTPPIPLLAKELPVGKEICFKPKRSDPGFWDSLTGAVGDLFDYFVSAVNWVSDAYAQIKEFALDAAVLVAGEDMRGILSVALDGALAAVGVPPELPCFDDLKNMGKDYLVQMVAEQAPGVGAVVAEQAIGTMIDESTKTRAGGADPANWLAPAPSKLYRPAIVMVTVRNPGTKRSAPVTLNVDCDGSGAYDQYNAVTNRWEKKPYQARLLSATAPVPALAPGQVLQIPVYLQEPCETLTSVVRKGEYFVMDPAQDAAARWLVLYRNAGFMSLSVTTTARHVEGEARASAGPVPQFQKAGLTGTEPATF